MTFTILYFSTKYDHELIFNIITKKIKSIIYPNSPGIKDKFTDEKYYSN